MEGENYKILASDTCLTELEDDVVSFFNLANQKCHSSIKSTVMYSVVR